MKVLGVDPGTGKVGWGIVSHENGNDSLIKCGCFETTVKSALPERLQKIYIFLRDLIKKTKPDI
jgi:crossover junction endodeoxyribonuclease RuvC